jgi:pilus assembly protein Flp/PilA
MFAYTLTLLQQVKADRKGVTALEYGVIAAAIVGALVVAMAALVPQLTATFGAITTALTP